MVIAMNIFKKLLVSALFLTFVHISFSQTSISNKETHHPHPSAVLDLISDDKGFLLTRMSTDNRNDIDDPAESLLIFNSETKCIEIYLGGEWHDVWCSEVEPFAECGDNLSFTYRGSTVVYGTIESPTTGECWLDRNLGASKVAQSYDDEDAFGDLFQWGRLDDGHQDRESNTTTTTSADNSPGHNEFIINTNNPYSWQVPQTCDLWQSASCENNPCPPGWKVPDRDEWTAETGAWESDDYREDAFNTLKLTAAGNRSHFSGDLDNAGSRGYYWTTECTPNYYSGDPNYHGAFRQIISEESKWRLRHRLGEGQAIRCIKK